MLGVSRSTVAEMARIGRARHRWSWVLLTSSPTATCAGWSTRRRRGLILGYGEVAVAQLRKDLEALRRAASG
jgi:hypothetical protein